MSHAPTLDRPSPPSLTSPRPDPASRFRAAHGGLALVHLAQAVLVLVVAGDVVLPITHQVGAVGERPWLDEVASWLRTRFPIETIVSDLDTDPWTVHAGSAAHAAGPSEKEPQP